MAMRATWSLPTMLMAMIAVTACGKPAAKADGSGKPAPAKPGQPEAQAQAPAPAPAEVAAATVVLATPDGKTVRVKVEVARTAEERRKGLMYRQNLAPDAGMLFLFEEDEIHTFWMKNTLIPLDMIFIRADGTVAGVVDSAEPRTSTGRGIEEPSRHVLEVNGGFARTHGIVAGTKVSYEHIAEVP